MSTLEHRRPERSTLSLAASNRKPIRGHDAVLKALQAGQRPTTLVTLSGQVFEGFVTGTDKYTITLQTTDDGVKTRRIFYKHSLEQFFGEEPQQ